MELVRYLYQIDSFFTFFIFAKFKGDWYIIAIKWLPILPHWTTDYAADFWWINFHKRAEICYVRFEQIDFLHFNTVPHLASRLAVRRICLIAFSSSITWGLPPLLSARSILLFISSIWSSWCLLLCSILVINRYYDDSEKIPRCLRR